MSKSKIIAVFNQAGGVAKTTLSQNLGYHLSQRGNRVLLIDLDPQASLTIFMGLKPRSLEQSLYNAIVEEEPLAISKGIHGMDLAATNQTLSIAEMQLASADLRDFRLKEAIKPVQENYDYIIVDCPPSLGLLSYITLVAATHVLVPIETHFKAFEGTNELLKTFTRVKAKANKELQIAGFVPTKYDSRNSADTRVLEAINSQLDKIGKVLAPVPRSTAFVDASEERMPLALYAPKHPVLPVLTQLAKELESC